MVLFITNWILTYFVSIILSFTAARYTGFIYIGFIVAYWLYCYETPLTKSNKQVVNILLVIQLIGGVFIVSKDIQLPFSNSYRVNELVKEVPANEKIVTDYWTLSTLEAYTDKTYYCIDLQKEMAFILWDGRFKATAHDPHPLYHGIKDLLEKAEIKRVNFISTKSPRNLYLTDRQLYKLFHVELIDKRGGAIVKGSNLYLYQISAN